MDAGDRVSVGFAIQRAKWPLIANAILLAAYLYIAQSMWHEVEDLGVAISRGIAEAPILVIAAILNLVWLVAVIAKVARTSADWPRSLPIFVTVAAWCLAFALDRSQWGPPAA